MFVSQNQFYYFVECLFIGIISGFIYEFFFFIKLFLKNYFLRQTLDFIFFVAPAALYLKFSEIFLFPNFRAYMFWGVLGGFLLYIVSFHKIVAKFSEMVYNKTISFIREVHRDRKQKEKPNRGINRRGDNRLFCARFNTCISNGCNNRKKQPKSRT